MVVVTSRRFTASLAAELLVGYKFADIYYYIQKSILAHFITRGFGVLGREKQRNAFTKRKVIDSSEEIKPKEGIEIDSKLVGTVPLGRGPSP